MKASRARAAGLLLFVISLSFSLAGAAAAARPYRGSAKWSILLCNFSDSAAPARSADFFRDMILRTGTGGLSDYWRDVSYGRFNLDGSVVMGWYTESFTTAQASARTRAEKFQDCIDAARTAATGAYTPPSDHLVAVITNPGVDLFGWPGRGAFLSVDTEIGALAHETSHGLGMNHSFSDDPNYRNASWAQIGEYDDQWDVMSYANVYGVPAGRFGYGGPGMNAYHLDRQGWLPRDRILTFGSDGASAGTVTLAALNHPEAPGPLLLRIPFDPGDLFHYFTVEYRRRDGWDGGIPGDIVLIHEVKPGADGQYYSYLLRDHTGARNPVQALNRDGVLLSISSMGGGANQATVAVTSAIADRCLQGYVWREARPSDHVCVTPATREQARQDNAAAASRVDPNGGPFGPDTCLVPWVWREAYSGDHVCVTVETRAQAAADNAQATNRLAKP